MKGILIFSNEEVLKYKKREGLNASQGWRYCEYG